MSTETSDPITTVTAEINYLDPASTILRRFTAPGASVNTGHYRAYDVEVRDGRPIKDAFSLEVQGFEIVDFPSAVSDFTDRQEVDRVYVPEVVDFVKRRLGADQVISRGWITRRAAAPKENSSQPAAALVHIDYSADGATMSAEQAYRESFPDGPGYSRIAATSTWRVFSDPPQDWPLAMVDFRTVGDAEGLNNTLYFVDELPEDPISAPVDGLTAKTSGSEFTYRPAHDWWYFSDMNRDEALFFVFYDSDHSHAWRCIHTAFEDPSVQTDVPRFSIEFRTFAYFS